MIRRAITKRTRIILGVLSCLMLLGAYTYLSHRQHQKNPDDTTIPSWSQLLGGVKSIVAYHENDKGRWIALDTRSSGIRLGLGVLAGVVGAMAFGMAMGCWSAGEAFFYPPMSLLAKVPPTAAMAIFWVFCDLDYEMHAAMIAFGILPTLAMTVYLAVKSFPDELQFKAYTLGASHAEVIFTIIFRQVFPNLLEALRLAIGPAMVFLIAAEYQAAEDGIGFRIRQAFRLSSMDIVYPYLALLATFGYLIDYGLRQLQRIICPWYGDHRH